MRDRPRQKSKFLPQYHLFFNKSQQFLPIALNCRTLLAIADNWQELLAISGFCQQFATMPKHNCCKLLQLGTTYSAATLAIPFYWTYQFLAH